MMSAVGSLVGGVEQQIKRCDLHPLGWFAVVGGPSLDSLMCKNVTVDPDPTKCQWSSFWGVPANASGPQVVEGKECGAFPSCMRWSFWDSHEQCVANALSLP